MLEPLSARDSVHGSLACALVCAAMAGICHTIFTRLRLWNAPFPFEKGSVAQELRAWAVGALFGQAVIAIPWVVSNYHVTLIEASWGNFYAMPFLSPLYIVGFVQRVRSRVSPNVPLLMQIVAALMVGTHYWVQMCLEHNPEKKIEWTVIHDSIQASFLAYMAFLTFQFINRYNVATLHVMRAREAAHEQAIGSSFFVWFHLVLGNVLFFLLLATGLSGGKGNWWLLVSLTLTCMPTVPNVLTYTSGRELDVGAEMKRYLIGVVTVFLLLIIFPPSPIAWCVANQLWRSHRLDWQNLDALEDRGSSSTQFWPTLTSIFVSNQVGNESRTFVGVGRPLGFDSTTEYGTAATPRAYNYASIPPPHQAAQHAPPHIPQQGGHEAPRAQVPDTIPCLNPSHSSPPTDDDVTRQREQRAKAAEERMRVLNLQHPEDV